MSIAFYHFNAVIYGFYSRDDRHGPPPRGDSHMKGAGMLVVSVRGVNF